MKRAPDARVLRLPHSSRIRRPPHGTRIRRLPQGAPARQSALGASVRQLAHGLRVRRSPQGARIRWLPQGASARRRSALGDSARRSALGDFFRQLAHGVRIWALQTRLELKLLLRLRWPLLFPPAAGLWMLLQLGRFDPSVSSDIYRHLIDSQSTFHTLSLGLPLFLGILLVRRDVLNPAYEWTHSLPVSNPAFVFSKFAAGFLYMATVLLFFDAAYLAQAVRSGLDADEALRQLWLLDLDGLWSYGISLILGMTLGTLLPARFALPIGFCAWVFGSVFLQVFIVERNGWYPLKAFYLNHLLESGPVWSEVWGASLAGAEYARMRLFVAAFGLFLLLWTAAALRRERPDGPSRRAVAAAAAALLLAGCAFVPYAQLWSVRYGRVHALSAMSPADADIRPQARYAFRLDSLSLDVTRRPDDRLIARAVLVVPTSGGRPLPPAGAAGAWTPREDGKLTFLLYPFLKVTGVTVNGRNAAFTRSGDRLSIPLSALAPDAARQTVAVDYAGKLDEWTYASGDESFNAFVRGASVYLPADLGWYPLPGGDSLLLRRNGLPAVRSDAAESFRAAVDVRLRGFPGPLYATLPEAPDSRAGALHYKTADAGAFAAAGAAGLREYRVPGEPVSVVTTPANRGAALDFLAGLSARRRYYEGWLGPLRGTLARVMYLPNDAVRLGQSRPADPATGGSTLFASEAIYEPLSAYLSDALRQLLFGDGNASSFADDPQVPSLVQEIRYAILVMYEWENPGAAGGGFAAAPGPDGGDDQPAIERLEYAIRSDAASGRLEAAKRTLKAFYEQGLHIDAPPGREAAPPADPHHPGYPVIAWDDWSRVRSQSLATTGGNGP